MKRRLRLVPAAALSAAAAVGAGTQPALPGGEFAAERQVRAVPATLEWPDFLQASPDAPLDRNQEPSR
ncbi:hypothetical protein [Streptomyces sp. NPDC015130]|uniref:hypothetical protein n=1 Tax=Streptomyces sp. NPDC015130 TaxID=3364940 RepID=UPI0036F8DBF1